MGAINSWNKTQHQFSILSLKTYNSTKIKGFLCKKMHWEILMKKLKGVILSKQTYYNFLNNLLIRSNINTD